MPADGRGGPVQFLRGFVVVGLPAEIGIELVEHLLVNLFQRCPLLGGNLGKGVPNHIGQDGLGVGHVVPEPQLLLDVLNGSLNIFCKVVEGVRPFMRQRPIALGFGNPDCFRPGEIGGGRFTAPMDSPVGNLELVLAVGIGA